MEDLEKKTMTPKEFDREVDRSFNQILPTDKELNTCLNIAYAAIIVPVVIAYGYQWVNHWSEVVKNSQQLVQDISKLVRYLT